jgi:hypothetical protein
MPDLSKIIQGVKASVKPPCPPAQADPVPPPVAAAKVTQDLTPVDLPTPPPIDFEFERSKERLRVDLETIDKHSPTFKIVPAEYKNYITYVARTLVQNALDRNMQLDTDRHLFYCDAVNETMHMMYPLLGPALTAIEDAVENARLASERGMEDARVDERTTAFERGILKQFHDLKALDFPYTEIDGRNLCKELVADCEAKLIRRVEFRKKRASGLIVTLEMKETVVEAEELGSKKVQEEAIRQKGIQVA